MIAALPQSDRQTKKRPVVLLREMPRYRDFLVCGISSQLTASSPGFDDLIAPADADFAASGLLGTSVVRLSFLTVLPRTQIVGSIGAISPERHRKLLQVLSAYLVSEPLAI